MHADPPVRLAPTTTNVSTTITRVPHKSCIRSLRLPKAPPGRRQPTALVPDWTGAGSPNTCNQPALSQPGGAPPPQGTAHEDLRSLPGDGRCQPVGQRAPVAGD